MNPYSPTERVLQQVVEKISDAQKLTGFKIPEINLTHGERDKYVQRIKKDERDLRIKNLLPWVNHFVLVSGLRRLDLRVIDKDKDRFLGARRLVESNVSGKCLNFFTFIEETFRETSSMSVFYDRIKIQHELLWRDVIYLEGASEHFDRLLCEAIYAVVIGLKIRVYGDARKSFAELCPGVSPRPHFGRIASL